ALHRAPDAPADRYAKAHARAVCRTIGRLDIELLARKRIEHEMAARDRSALSVDALEVGASRQTRAPPRGSSGAIHRKAPLNREPVAPLLATALDREPAGAGAHP